MKKNLLFAQRSLLKGEHQILNPLAGVLFLLHMQYHHSQTENVTTELLDLFHEMNATFLLENKAC